MDALLLVVADGLQRLVFGMYFPDVLEAEVSSLLIWRRWASVLPDELLLVELLVLGSDGLHVLNPLHVLASYRLEFIFLFL